MVFKISIIIYGIIIIDDIISKLGKLTKLVNN